MSAPQIELPGELGSLAPPTIPTVGAAEPYPPTLATVTALPSSGDTGPIDLTSAPDFTAVPRPTLSVSAPPTTRPEPVTIHPAPAPKPDTPRPDFTIAPYPVTSAPDPRTTYSTPAPIRPTTRTPRPERTLQPEPQPPVVGQTPAEPGVSAPSNPDPKPTGTRFIGESAYSVIYWVSVAIGLVGQVIGYGPAFGGTPLSYVAASLVGGIFELTMITSGDKALNWISAGRRWWEFTPFLLISIAAASVAGYMVLTHWQHLNPQLALYFAGVAVGGYLGHMINGVFTAVHDRRTLRAWQRRREEAEQRQREAAEQAQREREEAERQRREAVEAEAEQQARREREEAERQRRVEANREYIQKAERLLAKRPKRGTAIDKPHALALGVYYEVTTPATLADKVQQAGYQMPTSKDTTKGWCRDIKQLLGTAT